MAFTRTLAQLKAAVQRVGQLENSIDITGTVLLGIVNDALSETREILVDAFGEDYFTISGNISLVAGTTTYNLPTDFYKLRHVELDIGGGEFARLRSHDLTAKNYYGSTANAERPRYRMQAGSLVFAPPPASAGTVVVYYVPLVTELAVDADTVTFRVPLEFKLFLQAALRDCLQRQELDTTSADRQIDKLTKRVMNSAANRDVAEPFYLDPRGAHGDWWDEDDAEVH